MATARRRSVNKKTPAKFRSPHHASQDRIFQSTNVYLMTNLPYIWLNKFGISDHTKRRAKNVSDTTPGAVDTIIDTGMPYGKHCESFVHTFYFFLRTPFDKGSGRTEWFVIVSPVVGFLVFWITGLLEIKLPLLAYGLSFFSLAFGWMAYFGWPFFGRLETRLRRSKYCFTLRFFWPRFIFTLKRIRNEANTNIL